MRAGKAVLSSLLKSGSSEGLEGTLGCSIALQATGSELSQAQIDWHIDLLNRRSGNSHESHPFSILHHLMKVYQHPDLMPPSQAPTGEQAIRNCPKLESVVRCLEEIRRKSEKALIFTRSIDMQQLLALTLEHVFGFRIHIVNGATGKDVRRGINNSRRAITFPMLCRCSNPGGSSVLLSPSSSSNSSPTKFQPST